MSKLQLLTRLPIVVGSIACVASIGVWAQTGAQAPQKPAAAASSAPRYVAIGCIAREAPAAERGRGSATAPRFVLTDRRSDPPTVYQLDGDRSQLDLHIGHTVEIAGPLTVAKAATGRGGAIEILTLKVQSLTWISTTCAGA
jgi:hypothetical protein